MGLKKLASGVVKEGKRVRWPKRDVLLPTIAVVIIIAVICGLLLTLEDYAGNTLLEILRESFEGLKK